MLSIEDARLFLITFWYTLSAIGSLASFVSQLWIVSEYVGAGAVSVFGVFDRPLWHSSAGDLPPDCRPRRFRSDQRSSKRAQSLLFLFRPLSRSLAFRIRVHCGKSR